jgi:hypothetical protein
LVNKKKLIGGLPRLVTQAIAMVVMVVGGNLAKMFELVGAVLVVTTKILRLRGIN